MLLTHNIKLTGHKNLHVTLGFPEVISHRSVLVLEIQGVFEGLLPPCIVLTPGERVEGGGDGRVSVFGGEFSVFRDSNYKFYITNLICLTIYMQTERCCIACYF